MMPMARSPFWSYGNASLSRKITLVMVLGGLLVTILMAGIAYSWSYRLVLGNIKSVQKLLVHQEARDIELRVESAVALAKSLASNTVTANALGDSYGRTNYLEPLFAGQKLPIAKAGIFLTDYQGNIIVSGGEAGEPDDHARHVTLTRQTIDQGQSVARIIHQEDGEYPVILVSFPVIYRLTGQTEGVLFLRIPLAGVLEDRKASSHLLGLFGGDQRLLAGARGGLDALQTSEILELPDPLQSLELNAVIAQDRDVAMRDLDALLLIFLVAGTFLLMGIVVISRVSARLLSRPLTDLTMAVSRVVEPGHPGSISGMQRPDEFGLLARAFQDMLTRLSDSYASLEKKVQERTHALLASEQRFSSILEAMIDTVWSLSPDGESVVYVSPSVKEMAGISAERLRESLEPFFSSVHQADQGLVKTALKALVASGQAVDIEFRYHHPSLGIRYFCARAHTVLDAAGNVIRLDGILTDVTRRVELEVDLRNRELYLRAILDNFPFLIWLKDEESRFLAVNAVFAKACGAGAPDDLCGLTDLDIWPAELAEQYRRDDRQVIAAKAEKNVEEPCLLGEELGWIETYKKPVVSPDGNVLGTVGYARDITARKQMERQLAENEERWNLAISGSNDGIWDWNLETNSIYFSDRWKMMLGYQPEDIQNQYLELESRIHPHDLDRFKEAINNHLEKASGIYQVEYRILCKNGQYRWILARGKAVRNYNDKPTRFVGSHSDIHERVTAEQKLRLRTTQLTSIFALSPDGFVAFGEDEKIEYISEVLSGLIGLSIDDFIGKSESDLIDVLERQCITGSKESQRTFALLRSTEVYKNSFDEPKKLLIEVSNPQYTVIEVGRRYSTDSVVSKIYYFRDATRETEVDRLKSEFLSMAAHELRTPMVSIYGFSELLLNSTEFDAETTHELIETIHRQSVQMTSIINELLDLARIESRRGLDFDMESLDLNLLISEAIRGFKCQGGDRFPIVKLLDHPTSILGDRRKISQAVINILSNAFKYSPSGGEVVVSLRQSSIGDHEGYSIDIRDHGIGMSEKTVVRVCERFFRADATGNIPGTGLGMSIVKEIMELHGGTVSIASSLGFGSTVSVWLPREKNDEGRTACSREI
jgi:PAS domain S-box-containing protein